MFLKKEPTLALHRDLELQGADAAQDGAPRGAAPALPPGVVRGAFLVAPPADSVLIEAAGPGFTPLPREPLPFPSVLVASRNDPFAPYEESEEISYAWGSRLLDAGEAGHLNIDSGHGPWPEGLMSLAGFLKQL